MDTENNIPTIEELANLSEKVSKIISERNEQFATDMLNMIEQFIIENQCSIDELLKAIEFWKQGISYGL